MPFHTGILKTSINNRIYLKPSTLSMDIVERIEYDPNRLNAFLVAEPLNKMDQLKQKFLMETIKTLVKALQQKKMK